MALVQNQSIPQNSFYVPEDAHNKSESTNDQIIKKTPLLGARIYADKLTNDVFTYASKGMRGSKNSNFYEFLSLGIIPNLVGSAMLILLFNGANGAFANPAKTFANMNGKKMGLGVVFYALGKWLGTKAINKGVELNTGVDLEMPYKKFVTELPENKNDKDLSAIEYHRVFESAEFPRFDLLYKQGEAKGNRLEWFDKIALRMGFKKDELNSSDQAVMPAVRELIVKSNAAKSIAPYFWAATGVALAAQEPFGNKISVAQGTKLDRLKSFGRNTASTLKESFVDLYTGRKAMHTGASKYVGKALIWGTALVTALSIFNSVRGFKVAKHQPDTKIDTSKDYEVQ